MASVSNVEYQMGQFCVSSFTIVVGKAVYGSNELLWWCDTKLVNFGLVGVSLGDVNVQMHLGVPRPAIDLFFHRSFSLLAPDPHKNLFCDFFGILFPTISQIFFEIEYSWIWRKMFVNPNVLAECFYRNMLT